MDPESSIATYLTFDDPGFQFGGSAEIRDFVIDSFHDEWNQSGENGAYSKGTVDYKSAYGFSSGVLQP